MAEKLNILLVSQYFWPEEFRINDLADELYKKGHQITVLTGKPNYPSGKIVKGYKWWGYTQEIRNGIKIIRVPLLPRGNASGVRLVLNYFSFVVFSCLYILFHKKKYDVSLTFAVSPITQVYAALLHKFLYHSRAYLWVQDLWPESVTAAGKVQNKLVLKLLTLMVKNIYHNVDGIWIQSEAFKDSILQLGDFNDKIRYVPNWAEEIFEHHEKVDILKYEKIIPDGFKIMFAGNIGEAQDLMSLIDAVKLTKNHINIQWIIIGDGRKRKEIEDKCRQYNLNNIHFLGRYPVSEMPNFFVHADATLVTLKDEYIFSLTIPSKIQSYMAFGKPLLTMLNGIGNVIVEEANCGLIADAANYKKLAENAIKMSILSQQELDEIGKNAYNYYRNHFSRGQVIDSMVYFLRIGSK